MSEKQLLIEASEFLSPIVVDKSLKESVSIENNNDVLIVRNIPATIADRKNQNGRIYSTKVLEDAIKNAQFQLKNKWLYSQADEHPEGSFVAPTHASHVVTNAYMKKNVKMFVEGKTEVHNVMFMDWEILNTVEGKNLKALILQETACPTSIRGLGDMEGDRVVNYELLGCDIVSNPSSGTSIRMPVTESVKVESINKKAIDESFEVVTVSSDVVSDINEASIKQDNIEQAKYGSITKINTKLDQDIDPKTGANTTITTIEATTSDEVGTLSQALDMAGKAFTNPVSTIDSITINYINDKDRAKESTEENQQAIKEEGEAEGNSSEEAPEENDNASSEPEEIEDFNVDDLSNELETSDEIDDNPPEDAGQTIEEPSDEIEISDEPEDVDINTEYEVTESIDSTMVDDLKAAIQKIDDQVFKEQDPEAIKALEKDRSDIVKLIVKKLDSEKELANATEQEDLPVNEAELTADNNVVTAQIDDNTEVSKEFDDNTTAQIAKAGIENGKIDPAIMVTEEDEAVQSEKLYTNPDEPSDPLAKQPLEDDASEDQNINITLSNIDYDITDDEENLDEADEELANNLPDEVVVTLNINEIPQEGEVDKYILQAASDQLGLPIKNADITNVSMDLIPDNESINESEGDSYKNYNVYGFINGMNKFLQSYDNEEEAKKAAEDFKNQNKDAENFQVIIAGIADDNIEDFDNLVYRYPESDFENYEDDEEKEESSNSNEEFEDNDYLEDPEELPDDRDYGLEDTLAMYHNAGIDG